MHGPRKTAGALAHQVHLSRSGQSPARSASLRPGKNIAIENPPRVESSVADIVDVFTGGPRRKRGDDPDDNLLAYFGIPNLFCAIILSISVRFHLP